ncbi:helix-turn-helix domain-containing protein [Pseudogemmobacter hezensis]|uniref:helix-turn-helix domain-containing protein n=1 Tax=Pseudogemmobacter hezensis TaxID=2737662 RepID=UPI0020A69F2B|nr:helix-turn-helix transcriptional regulator [Pseudogemmobacter hezensis]
MRVYAFDVQTAIFSSYAVANTTILSSMAHIDFIYAKAYSSLMADLARTPRQIGTIIQRERKKRGWTQSDLAARAGLRQATISTIETAEKPAKLESLLAVLAALDLEFQITPRSKGDRTDIEDLF